MPASLQAPEGSVGPASEPDARGLFSAAQAMMGWASVLGIRRARAGAGAGAGAEARGQGAGQAEVVKLRRHFEGAAEAQPDRHGSPAPRRRAAAPPSGHAASLTPY